MSEEPPPSDMQGGVESNLGPQLGSDQADLNVGSMDIRRLGVLDRQLIMPMLYCKIRALRGSTTFEVVRNEVLNMNVSVGGRGRRDLIRMQVASRGGGVNVESEIEASKPSWLQRNISDRDWKEDKRKELNEA